MIAPDRSLRNQGCNSADSSDVLLRLAVEGVGIVRMGELTVGRTTSASAEVTVCRTTRQP